MEHFEAVRAVFEARPHAVAAAVGVVVVGALVAALSGGKRTPGPPGGLREFLKRTAEYTKHTAFVEWANTYGPVFCLRLFGMPAAYVCTDAAETRRLLGPLKDHAGGHLKEMGPYRVVFGECMVASNHKAWNDRRKAIKHLLTLGAAQDTIPHLKTYITKLLSVLDSKADGKRTIDIQEELLRYGFDQAAHSMWGLRADSMSRDGHWDECFHLLEEMLADYFPMFSGSIWCVLGGWRMIDVFKYLPSWLAPGCAKYLKDHNRMWEIGIKKMEERMAELRAKGLDTEDNVLSNLMKIPSPATGKPFTALELTTDFWDLQNGGYDTTAHSAAFLLLNLGLNPDHLKKCQDEVDAIMGEKEFPEWDDMKKMTHLDACLKESMRRWTPSSAATVRQTITNETICGHKVPKGTVIFFPIHALQNIDRYWTDPLEFKPERFMTDAAEVGVPAVPSALGPFKPEKGSPGPWMSFVYGPRSCLGQTLGLIHLKLLLSTLLHRYSLELVESNPPLPVQCFQLHVREGIKVRMTLRR